MIKVRKHHLFKKYYQKLSSKQKALFIQRIQILQQNPRHPLLKIHKLKGKLKDFYAFSLGGDLRVCFIWFDKNTIRLYKIGTHNQVY